MSATLVFPGEPIALPSSSRSVVLGPGIAPILPRVRSAASESEASGSRSGSGAGCIATRLGVLGTAKGKEKSEQIWVEGSSRRYIAAQKDMVLGTIIARHAEGYRVDLGSAQMASLEALAFEGATKRSKPNLKVGTLVYARVSLANRDMEPEIECFDPNTGKAEGFGELKGGLMLSCSLQLCRQLLSPKFYLLPTLAAVFPFEVAVGLNGRVWFKAGSIGESIAFKRLVEAVDRGEVVDKAGAIEAVKEFLA